MSSVTYPVKILLIVQVIPESLKMYSLSVTKEEARVLKLANTVLVGCAGASRAAEDAATWVLAAVDKNRMNWEDSDVPEDWLDKGWAKYELDSASRPKVPESTVIVVSLVS